MSTHMNLEITTECPPETLAERHLRAWNYVEQMNVVTARNGEGYLGQVIPVDPVAIRAELAREEAELEERKKKLDVLVDGPEAELTMPEFRTLPADASTELDIPDFCSRADTTTTSSPFVQDYQEQLGWMREREVLADAA